MASVHASLCVWGKEVLSWERLDVEELALRLRNALWRACDTSMPRVRRECERRSAYWWTEESAKLREASVQARRRLQRFLRRRNRDEAGTDRRGESIGRPGAPLAQPSGGLRPGPWRISSPP